MVTFKACCKVDSVSSLYCHGQGRRVNYLSSQAVRLELGPHLHVDFLAIGNLLNNTSDLTLYLGHGSHKLYSEIAITTFKIIVDAEGLGRYGIDHPLIMKLNHIDTPMHQFSGFMSCLHYHTNVMVLGDVTGYIYVEAQCTLRLPPIPAPSFDTGVLTMMHLHTDALIVMEEGSIPFHKAVLRHESRLIADLIDCNVMSTTIPINHRNFGEEGMRGAVRFAYAKTLPNDANVVDIYKAADYILQAECISYCRNRIIDNLRAQLLQATTRPEVVEAIQECGVMFDFALQFDDQKILIHTSHVLRAYEWCYVKAYTRVGRGKMLEVILANPGYDLFV